MKILTRLSIALAALFLFLIAGIGITADNYVPARLRVQSLGLGAAPGNPGTISTTDSTGLLVRINGYTPIEAYSNTLRLHGQLDVGGSTAESNLELAAFDIPGVPSTASMYARNSSTEQAQFVLYAPEEGQTCANNGAVVVGVITPRPDDGCANLHVEGNITANNGNTVCLGTGAGCPFMFSVRDAGCNTGGCDCFAGAAVYNGTPATAVCVRSATGIYAIAFSGAEVACTATPNLAITANRNVATLEITSASAFIVHMQSDDSVDTAAHFSLTCMGELT